MSFITVRGHFDGEKILLDEKIKMKPNTKLIITVLGDDEYENWEELSIYGLNRAYGKDEIEYSLNMLKEKNPEYKP